MKIRPIQWLMGTTPLTLILAVTALKAIAFFVALPWFQHSFSAFYSIDFADNYQLLGENLAEGNGYRFTYDSAPTLMREAGYPLTLAALFSVFGFGLKIAQAANLLFAVASAVFVAQIAERATNSTNAARVAALLYVLHPGVVLSEARGGVESLFVMLLLCFLVATYHAINSRKLIEYFIAGLVLGIAANVRGTALLFPSFLVLYFFFWERPRPSIVLTVTRVTIMVVGSVIALTPWIIRNYELAGKFAPTASVAGVSSHAGQYICTHLSFSNNLITVDDEAALARAQLARDNGYRFKEMYSLYYLYFFDVHDEVEFNSYLGKQAMNHYIQTPALLFTCAAKNAFNFWFAGKTWTSTAMNAAVQLPYLVLAITGLFYGLRGQRSSQVGLLALFILYSLGVYLPILAQARYSIQLIPIVAILASIPLARWVGHRDSAPASVTPDTLNDERRLAGSRDTETTNNAMIRMELAIPAAVAVVLATMTTVASHRANIKTEFMTKCTRTATAEQCQAQWWKSPIRANWTTSDLWACWAGNPDTCAEAAAQESEAVAR